MPSRFFNPLATDKERTTVLLVNLGTPDAPTRAAVRRYLAEFLHDYRVVDLSRWLWCAILHFVILPIRSGIVAKKYASVWREDGSPLLALSKKLRDSVQAQCADFDVRLAMRYGNPSVSSVLREAQARGMKRLVVLPLYPQYSASTTAASHDAVMKELQSWRVMPELRLINDYHDNSEWLDAIEASIENHWDLRVRAEKILLSFHGLPQRFIRDGDPYAAQCEANAKKLAARLGLNEDQWLLTYQSRFGREPWLEPATDKTLAALGKQGIKTVDIICPGFAVDCLETLEEIKVENQEIFTHAGGEKLHYIAALNDSPGHACALAHLIKRHCQGWGH
jgi:protoporphyrin/coproporphyrin ferrochelatase